MSFVATWTVLTDDGANSGGELVVSTAQDIDTLLDALNSPGATAALIRHTNRAAVPDGSGGMVPDHDMSAGVWQGYGYLTYTDTEHEYETLTGDPDSPAYPAHYVEYDAGTGVDLPTLRQALVEFLHTAQRPTSVAWQPAV